MAGVLWFLCILLTGICIFLAGKLFLMRKAADEIRREFAERLKADSNVEIVLSSRDAHMRKLAADMNQQLKLLRKEHIRYVRGDMELKCAITNISHDLRTPLTAVCGYMELLQKEEVSAPVRKYLTIIKQRVDALKDMTEELFQYSIIVSADTTGKKEKISLNRILEECVAGHYGALKAVGIEPEIKMADCTVYCEGNLQAVSRILQNMMSNAIKYSDGDLKIVLKEDGKVCFSNTANGLDEIQTGHLFDRFYTVENGRASTGLGLSIAKTLTEEMGGRIEARYCGNVLSVTISFPTVPKQRN